MKTKFLLLTFLLGCILVSRAQVTSLSEAVLKPFQQSTCDHDGQCTKSCYSMVLKMARENLESLTPEARDIVEGMRNRPQFQGTEQMATLGIYVFHYSLDGPADESIDPTDNDASGFPDYLEFMAFTFLDVAERYHDEEGYTLPPHDGDELNGAYYDVYIGGSFAGENVYGFVAQDTKIGDNPNSTHLKENDAATSYMVMRNNYHDFSGSQEKNIQVTAAHEYLHAVQYGYWTDMEFFMFEGSAAWAEEFMYPGHDDNFQYLSGIFQLSDVAMNLEPGEVPDLDGHWYSTWLFFKYLTERHGDDIIRNIYEAGIRNYSYPAMDEVLTDRGDNMLNLFASFYIAAGLCTDSGNADPFVLDRAQDYRDATGGMTVEGQTYFQGTPFYFNSVDDGDGILMRTGCDYHYFQSDLDFRVDAIQGSGDGEVLFLLVKGAGQYPNVTKLEVEQLSVNGNQRLVLVDDNAEFDWYVLMALRADFDGQTTNSLQYEYQISPLSNVATVDISDRFQIRSYPTIVQEQISIDPVDFTEDYHIDIIDVHGSQVGHFGQNLKRVDVRGLSAATYFLMLTDESGRLVHKQKFVKP